MGLSASQMRLMSLTARKSDLEFQGQQINQARMNLAYRTEELTTEYSDKMSNKYQDVFTPQDIMTNIQTGLASALMVNSIDLLDGNGLQTTANLTNNSIPDTTELMNENETQKLIDDLVILRDSVQKGDTKLIAANTLGYGMNAADRSAALATPQGVQGKNFSNDQLISYLDTMIAGLKSAKKGGNDGLTKAEFKDIANQAAIALVNTNNTSDTHDGDQAAISNNTGASMWFLQRILGPNATAQPSGQQGGIAFGKLDADGYYTEDDAAAEAKYKADSARIQTQDKRLEVMEKNIDTQHKAIETEIDAVKKVLDKNIETSFKTFA